MANTKATILVVDDNEMQVSLIQHHLTSLSYANNTVTANNGSSAWELLSENPQLYDVILLDRKMPGLHGIEVLNRMRKHPVLKHTPVILQTALSNREEIIEGMAAGAYYYLTKPYERELLLPIVGAALGERIRFNDLQNALTKQNNSIRSLKSAEFEFKTINEANDISTLLANICTEPENIVNGLSELLINAIEHGNLNLSYEDKSKLTKKGDWSAELERRLSLPEYKNRIATVKISRTSTHINFEITDQGNGFDWSKYLNFEADRMMDNHGRGIAIANKLSFSTIEYKGKGNIVCASVKN